MALPGVKASAINRSQYFVHVAPFPTKLCNVCKPGILLMTAMATSQQVNMFL